MQVIAMKRLSLIKAFCRELDGEMSWLYAAAFAKVNKSLTSEQRASLVKLRNLDGHKSAAYCIYADAKNDAPSLPDTDSFFAKVGTVYRGASSHLRAQNGFNAPATA